MLVKIMSYIYFVKAKLVYSDNEAGLPDRYNHHFPKETLALSNFQTQGD